jgi:hypothetical protein
MWDIAAETGCGPELDRYVEALPVQYRDAAYQWSVRLTVLRNVLAERERDDRSESEKPGEHRLRLRRSDDDKGTERPPSGRGRS